MSAKGVLIAALSAIFLLGSLLFIGASDMSAGGSKDIKEARKYAEETLLPQEGVAGISDSGDSIIVYVEHEKYKGKIPDKIKGFPTQVVVSDKLEALSLVELESPLITLLPQYESPVSRVGIVRPIVGGISIGVPEASYGAKMAGTLGVVTNNLYILSNAHVIAMDKNTKFLPIGTPVLQPGTYDGGTISNQVGSLYQYIKITFGPKGSNYADAAIASLTITDYLKAELLGADNQSTYTVSLTPTDAYIGDTVRKSGRTTGVTTNEIRDTAVTVKVWYAPGKFAIFKDQVLVNQPFINSGDSGSLVDKGGGFVGLAFAGSDTIAVVGKAKYIVSGLGIN